jgi:hypothetical protein
MRAPLKDRSAALTLGVLLLIPGAVVAQEAGSFVDVTATSGVTFSHETGAFGQKWLPETMGAGVVIFDYNGDDRQDLLFLNGRPFPGRKGKATTQALFRNRGDLSFADATREAGLDISAYCLAGAAADLDNDGDADLYLSCLGTDYLLRNEGGRFTDISKTAGLSRDYEFGASVALFDADRDGWLDILATRYVTWTPETDIRCSLDGVTKSRNRGDGTFEDLTVKAGVNAPNAKSLGTAVLDLDGDGWLDVAIANDTQPNLLLRNKGDGSFEEIGMLSGMAFSETGAARGGMGIDAADYDRSGRPSLIIGNFANEMTALYRNEGNLLFVDVAPPARIGRPTLFSLTFAAFFFDYDLDGWLDLLFGNGHLDPDIEKVQPNVRYAQPSQLFRNLGGSRFEDVSAGAGGDLAEPRVARGAAHADLDGDGDHDLVLTTNGGPAAVFENRGAATGHWLGVDLEGTQGNRDGVGAVVEVSAGGTRQSWLVRTGGSYCSQSQLYPTFGLGETGKVDEIVVRWPSGTIQRRAGVTADQRIKIIEQADQAAGSAR